MTWNGARYSYSYNGRLIESRIGAYVLLNGVIFIDLGMGMILNQDFNFQGRAIIRRLISLISLISLIPFLLLLKTKARYTLATKLHSTRSSLLKADCCQNRQQSGNNVNSTACRGRLCCRYVQLCCRYSRLCHQYGAKATRSIDFQQSRPCWIQLCLVASVYRLKTGRNVRLSNLLIRPIFLFFYVKSRQSSAAQEYKNLFNAKHEWTDMKRYSTIFFLFLFFSRFFCFLTFFLFFYFFLAFLVRGTCNNWHYLDHVKHVDDDYWWWWWWWMMLMMMMMTGQTAESGPFRDGRGSFEPSDAPWHLVAMSDASSRCLAPVASRCLCWTGIDGSASYINDHNLSEWQCVWCRQTVAVEQLTSFVPFN